MHQHLILGTEINQDSFSHEASILGEEKKTMSKCKCVCDVPGMQREAGRGLQGKGQFWILEAGRAEQVGDD